MENKNLWAPWRINYVQGLDPVRNSKKGPEDSDNNMAQKDKISNGVNKGGGCFICEANKSPEDDDKNFVLWRSAKSIVILNRYPYNNGHLLISPVRHIPGLEKMRDDELLELMKLVRESQKALSLVIKPHGFNVGMNFGRCAGAGLPDHFHIHLVPRWDGDTNFMAVCSDTDVISQSMTELLEQLKQVSKKHNLPNL
ncbi:MAG TPA: HIT domain-containing protein [Sedimentisphaerales bacterium]|nr:HIT domain-containing protein [Sedimentisphaerales bacterium]